MRIFIWLFCCVLTGCAYITIEDVLEPTVSKPDIDTQLYHPYDISNILYLNGIDLFIDTNHYEASYRGLSIATVEMSKETRVTNKTSDRLILIIGIKNKKDIVVYFKPYELIAIKNIRGTIYRAKVISAFKVNRGVTCDYDFNGVEWGTNSIKLDSTALELQSVSEGGYYECFNIIFDSDMSGLDSLSIDMQESLLPLDNKNIFFQRKKVKWIRGN